MENKANLSYVIKQGNLPVEYKTRLPEKGIENVVKLIACMANENGGYIVIGGESKNKIAGADKSETRKILDNLPVSIRNNLSPTPKIELSEETISGRNDKANFIIKIYASNSLILYKDLDGKASLLTRKNSNFYPMSKSEISLFLKQRASKCFDKELTSKKYNEIDFAELKKRWISIEESFCKQTLSNLGLLGMGEELTYGLFFFSNDSSYPSLRAVGNIYSGDEKREDELLSMSKSKGNILSLFDFCYSFIDGYIQLDSPSCPYKKEALINAILLTLAKRNYLDDENFITIDIFKSKICIGSNGDIANEGEFILPYFDKIKLTNRNELICRILSRIFPINFNDPFSKMSKNYNDEESSIYPLLKSGYQKFEFIFTSNLINQDDEVKEVIKGPIYKLDYKKITKGNRDYDNDILSLCFDSAKSRSEIAKLTPYTSRSSFLTSVLNPLLEASLLLPTTKFKTSPNNKYFTNTAKVKRIKK